MQKLFFELIQVTLGNKEQLERIPTEKEWAMLYDMACKQSLASFILEGVNRLSERVPSMKPPMNILFEWIGLQQQTITQNRLQNQRAKELYEEFKVAGYRSCILKGQGTALYYDHPEYRQCGDIDIWVEGDRNRVLNFIKERGTLTDGIDVQHTNAKFFQDVEVEVHFIPSFMYGPVNNRKLQRFFADKADSQFSNKIIELGFVHTTIEFDLVFSLVHIYRHLFSEGIGMRQLMDYYHILIHSDANQRKDAFAMLRRLGLKSFTGGIMWILLRSFGMKEEYLLCPVNSRHGEFVLSEMLIAGNFGHYDTRSVKIDPHDRLKRGVVLLKKNMRFLSYYPSEVLWSPFWKLWHWGWRKMKAYL